MRKDHIATTPHVGSGEISTDEYSFFSFKKVLWQCWFWSYFLFIAC